MLEAALASLLLMELFEHAGSFHRLAFSGTRRTFAYARALRSFKELDALAIRTLIS